MKADSVNNTNRKTHLVVGIVLLLITMLISSYGISNTHNWGGDFSQYIAQARAIVEGNLTEWYERNCFIIDHSAGAIGADSYPWITPILFAPIYAIWGLNYIPYQYFLSFCFAVSVAVLYLFLIRRNVRIVPALLICTAVIFNINFLTYTKNILSEIPCFMFTVISWIIIDMYLEKRSAKGAVLVGLCSFLAFSTRTTALALMAALGLGDLIFLFKQIKCKKMSLRSFAALCLPYGIFLFLVILISAVFPKSGTTYLEYFSLSIENIRVNIEYYYETTITLFTQNIEIAAELPAQVKVVTGLIPTYFPILLIPILVVAVVGGVKRIRNADFIPFYMLSMSLMLHFYIYRAGTRFVIYLMPAILLCAYYGFEQETVGKSPKWKSILQKIFVCDFYIVTSCSIVIGITMISCGFTKSPPEVISANSADALAVYDYINENLTEEDTVIFFKPRVLSLYTCVNSYTNSMDEPETIEGADYILDYAGDGRYDEYIQDNWNSLVVVYNNPRFSLFRIVKTDA